VVLITGLLASVIGGMVLLLAPWSIPGFREQLSHLAAGVGTLTWLILVSVGLWYHAGWTRWLLAIPAYVLGVLGLLFALREPDWIYQLRNATRAILFLVGAVWYFQFKPVVVSYYAAIEASRSHSPGSSGPNAA
jgi:hypothetical protein